MKSCRLLLFLFWQWGDEHQLQFSHPLSSVSPLQLIFNSKQAIPVSGSAVTVQAARRNDETGLVNHGASWRYVIDTSDMTKAYHILAPGQSGHFKSEWYNNQFEDWVTGDYHVTTLNEPINEDQTLILLPQ